jgi:hypothetical protein
VTTSFIYWVVRGILKELLIELREVSCQLLHVFSPFRSSAIHQRQVLPIITPSCIIEKRGSHLLFGVIFVKLKVWHINDDAPFPLRIIIVSRNVNLALDHQSGLLLSISSHFNHRCELPPMTWFDLLIDSTQIKRLVHQQCLLTFQFSACRIHYRFWFLLPLCDCELLVTFFNPHQVFVERILFLLLLRGISFLTKNQRHRCFWSKRLLCMIPADLLTLD